MLTPAVHAATTVATDLATFWVQTFNMVATHMPLELAALGVAALGAAARFAWNRRSRR
jgi:hypothetical protein